MHIGCISHNNLCKSLAKKFKVSFMNDEQDIIERQRRHKESLTTEIASKKAALKIFEDEIKVLEFEYDFYFNEVRTTQYFTELLKSDNAKIKIDGITLRRRYWSAPYFGSRGRLELAQLILKDSEDVCVRWNEEFRLKGSYHILSLGVLGDPCVECPTGFTYCWAYIRDKEFAQIPSYNETLLFVQKYCPGIKKLKVL